MRRERKVNTHKERSQSKVRVLALPGVEFREEKPFVVALLDQVPTVSVWVTHSVL